MQNFWENGRTNDDKISLKNLPEKIRRRFFSPAKFKIFPARSALNFHLVIFNSLQDELWTRILSGSRPPPLRPRSKNQFPPQKSRNFKILKL